LNYHFTKQISILPTSSLTNTSFFLEQGINLLADDGILGYIVPSKFTKVGAGKKLRELLADKEYLHSIVSFGANQVFADKTTYTCLLILNKKPQKTFQYAEVRSLKSWKVREPEAAKYGSKKTDELIVKFGF
jgi:type I restriction-modification system DNA methylase subunit